MSVSLDKSSPLAQIPEAVFENIICPYLPHETLKELSGCPDLRKSIFKSSEYCKEEDKLVISSKKLQQFPKNFKNLKKVKFYFLERN